ncbi:hypothetical protein HJG60_011963 [Phyllostomus discolor]|uniref:Uncharacterized protein n=1 Tax=Phyllostomus discolor TaxID=89673 RepID=A0A833ZP49_9CHIR|nr:hypothetical protein HJG60_011963 [Phyllostomus discolor]
MCQQLYLTIDMKVYEKSVCMTVIFLINIFCLPFTCVLAQGPHQEGLLDLTRLLAENLTEKAEAERILNKDNKGGHTLLDVKTHQKDAGLFDSAAPAREERKEIHESAQSIAQKCIRPETGPGNLSKESFPLQKGDPVTTAAVPMAERALPPVLRHGRTKDGLDSYSLSKT